MSYVCYILTFEKDDVKKKYVGYSGNFHRRLAVHLSVLRRNTHPNILLQDFFNSGGVFHPIPELFFFDDRESAKAKETEIIRNTIDDDEYVNIELLGDTLSRHPRKEERKVKLIESLDSLRKSLTAEDRAKMYSKPGSANPMFGKTHTPETRAKISENLAEFYSKNTSILLGKPKSPEHRAKMSVVASQRLGPKNPFFGKVHSSSSRDKISKANKGKIAPNRKPTVIDGIEYESVAAAARHIGIHTTVCLFRIKSKNPRFSEWNWI